MQPVPTVLETSNASWLPPLPRCSSSVLVETSLELRRDVHGETFFGSVAALGSLGIVTQLTLDIEPTYEMSQAVHVGVPLDEMQGRLDEVFSAGYSVAR